jgi:hypothetical protein
MNEEESVGMVVESISALIALFVISYLIAVDAKKKGRSGVGWGLLCFLTCFLAVPLYFLLTSEDKEK